MRLEVVDLFCGIGGLSAGFRKEGFDVVAGVDLDGTCQFAFEKNIKARFIHESVANLEGTALDDLYTKGSLKILVGCAPCQPFSSYTRRYRKDESQEQTDQRWAMLEEFARLIQSSRPDIISMENVTRVEAHPAFKRFVRSLEDADYQVSVFKVRAQDYGVPQKRTRLVLFASQFGRVALAPPTHANRPITVRKAISKLPAVGCGETHPSDRLHVARGLSDKNLRRLQATEEGGSWKNWKEDMQLDCHKSDRGKSFRAVYGRMKWDEPSPVITTQCLGIGNGRFGHPDQDRAITIREAAILQSFPSQFQFLPANAKVFGLHLARQIGNAVPVKLGQAVARSIMLHLREHEIVATTHQ